MRWMRKLERLLLWFGVSMLCIYAGARIYQFVFSRAEVDRFMGQKVLAQELKDKGEATNVTPDFSLWSIKRIQSYEESLAAHFTPAVAVLRVPKIHLVVPVLDGTDDLSLNRAVGHIAGTAYPGENGNIGIAGHRDGFFRGLKDLKAGDEIDITTQKETSKYLIDQITIVNPTDVSVLGPGSRSSITLVTCYPFYFIGSAPKRYIIHASLTNPSVTDPNANVAAKF